MRVTRTQVVVAVVGLVVLMALLSNMKPAETAHKPIVPAAESSAQAVTRDKLRICVEDTYDVLLEYQKVLDKAAGGRQNVIGNIAWHPSQYYYYFRHAAQPHVHNICEVGFGAGHSSVMFLVANPQATLYTLDIFDSSTYKFQNPGIQFIDEHFPGRQIRIKGDSNETIAKFAQQHPEFCDLVSIDGSHIPPQPYYDIVLFKGATKPGAPVLLDDMHMLPGEMKRAINDKVIEIWECMRGETRTDIRFTHMPFYGDDGGKQFCSVKYIL